MSFLSGILSAGKSAVKFLSGNSALSTLAKTALLGYAVNRMSKNALKGNDSGTKNIDQGVRLQVAPNADSKIPVLYGSAFFGGNISDAAMTNNNKTMWYCLVLSEKTGTQYSNSAASTYTFNNVYWNNQRIIFNTDGITVNYTVDSNGTIDRSLSGLIKVYCYAGGRTAGQVPIGYTGSVPNAETLFPNWTSGTHAMQNLVFALVRVDYNRERNVTGIGDMLFQITNSMNKPGDVVYDYLTNTVYGCGIAATDVITADITALNTYSAESVAYADQGTGAQTLEDRYQINGLIDTSNPVLENAEQILSACASWLSYDTHEGKWGVVINKSGTSVATFTDSNILGSISLGGTGLQDLYNTVKVEFPHRELRDSADFYNISVPTSSIPSNWTPFSRNLNEEDNILNLTYDIINEPVQAQMLGLIELKQSRIDKVIQFDVDFSYYNLKAGDIISVTNSRFGFVSKPFRIVSITEVQESDAALLMRITALEYDVNVYSVADLYRFTRSDVNGIITIGSIGVPGTPSVTKIERDARPRLVITSTAPTGVVEGLEFWLTTDVSIPDDANRSYTLIGIQRPVGGGVFASGTTVTLEYTTISGNFLVKTRGFNATTVGQYSNVSGLVEFAPTQVTDAIGPDTSAIDATGNLLTALALIDLVKGLDELYQGASGGGSLFDKIFEVFEDVTGVDLPAAFGGSTATYALSASTAQVTEGQSFIVTLTTVNVVNGTNVAYTITGVTTADINGSPLSGNFVVNNNTASIVFNTTADSSSEGVENFVLTLNASPTTTVSVAIVDAGQSVNYQLSSNPAVAIEGAPLVITLTTAGLTNGTTVPYTITGISSADISGAPLSGNFTINNNSASITLNIAQDGLSETESLTLSLTGLDQSITVAIVESDASALTILNLYPPNRETYLDPITGATTDMAPTAGSYYIRFAPATQGNYDIFYGPLSAGTGNVKLYKSDGTLVQTLTAASLTFDKNLVGLPFSNRTLGTDYYILMDKGVIKYCNDDSPAITSPLTWNFNTAPYSVDAYSLTGDNFAENVAFTLEEINLGENSCPNSTLSITFNREVTVGSGNVYIKNLSDNSTAGTIDVTTGIPVGDTVSLGSIQSFVSLGGEYYVTADAGAFQSVELDCNLDPVPSAAITISDNLTFSIVPVLQVTTWSVDTTPFTDDLQRVNKQTNIRLNFNRGIQFGTGNITLKGNGSNYQVFNVQTSFNTEFTSEIIWIEGSTLFLNPTTDLTPGHTYTIEADSGSIKDGCNLNWDGSNNVSFKVDPGPTSEPSPGFRS